MTFGCNVVFQECMSVSFSFLCFYVSLSVYNLNRAV